MDSYYSGEKHVTSPTIGIGKPLKLRQGLRSPLETTAAPIVLVSPSFLSPSPYPWCAVLPSCSRVRFH